MLVPVPVSIHSMQFAFVSRGDSFARRDDVCRSLASLRKNVENPHFPPRPRKVGLFAGRRISSCGLCLLFIVYCMRDAPSSEHMVIPTPTSYKLGVEAT